MNYSFLKRTPQADDLIEKAIEKEKADDLFGRIRCPLCRWQPQKTSLWWCADTDYPEYFYQGCFAAFNTFSTGGKCPGCGHQWRWTSCLRCACWSRHEDWYENGDEQK